MGILDLNCENNLIVLKNSTMDIKLLCCFIFGAKYVNNRWNCVKVLFVYRNATEILVYGIYGLVDE